ncbi:MAG: hypothetical protein MK179_05675 [Pirellulaceae bacterium]|nr:hypothetical protein [Pirellulaceae bacterium]
MSRVLSIYVGFDSTEADAFDVCKYSIQKYATQPIDVFPLKQHELREQGLYTRPIDQKASNEFSMTRWLTPYLSKTKYAIFMDCDMILTGDIFRLLDNLDDSKAVHVVQHDYVPKSSTKMSSGGVTKQQHVYPRKNWSSFVIWNCEHPAVAQVTPDLVNSCEPKYVHRFSFLQDDQIGDIGWWTTAQEGQETIRVPRVNFLVGEYPQPNTLPLVLHYTLAIPAIHEGCGDCDFFREWMDVRAEMLLDRRLRQLEKRVLPTAVPRAA